MTHGKFIPARAAAAVLLAAAAQAILAAADEPAERVLAARVDGEPIYVDELEPLFASALAGRTVAPDVERRLKAKTLEQLIDRRLVEKLLRDQKLLPDEAELALIERRARERLELQGSTLAQFLAQRRLTEAAWRDRLSWQTGWDRYLARELTDAALEEFFQGHRREFDGTQVRVRHILMKPRSHEAADVAEAVARAQEVRARIVAGEITFAAAAREHSDGPSKDEGGELGLVPRRGLVSEAFAAAAFALAPGELSQPVTTAAGVHLIEVVGEQPGTRSFGEVREQLRSPAAADLLAKLARRARASAKIEYTTDWPHE